MAKQSELQQLIQAEQERQEQTLMLIPSENYASPAVLACLGTNLSNKYSEGYPGRRYYEGNEVIDQIERLAIERAKKLFGVAHANVQPYSGSPANSEIQMALLEPGDTVMGLKLTGGGHLTHGHPKVTFSGKFFRSVQFGVNADGHIDMEAVRTMALEEQPKMMIIGSTAYPFQLDFAAFAKIADEVGAWLVADISHIAGLVIAGEHPDPAPHVHVIMTTTHKTLRGPRGAMILVTQKGLDRDPDLAKKIDMAVFPGMQGGPHNNVTAAIAQALDEASQPDYRNYAKQVRANAKTLAQALQEGGISVVGGGTDNHLLIIDVREWGGGTQLSYAMAKAGLYANKNTVPSEPHSAFYPSGVRLGTPALTTRGMGEAEMRQIAGWIVAIEKRVRQFALAQDAQPEQRREVIKAARAWADADQELTKIRQEVMAMCAKFPVWGNA